VRRIEDGRLTRPDFTVRAAETGEVAALVRLYEWLFAPPGEVPADWDPRRAAVALGEAIESRDSVILVAEAAQAGHAEGEPELIGLCSCYQELHSVRFGYRAWIEDLVVDPARRSQGVGKALLDAARGWARERGAMHIELDSSLSRTDAHRFYEREGAEYKSFSFGWRL
jgi:GNAT superfamily N-acetyltransferase